MISASLIRPENDTPTCFYSFPLMLFFLLLHCNFIITATNSESPTDMVNGFIGELLSPKTSMPTYSIVHYPDGLVRIRSDREDFATAYITGLSLGFISTNQKSSFLMKPSSNLTANFSNIHYSFDNEVATPYKYSILLYMFL